MKKIINTFFISKIEILLYHKAVYTRTSYDFSYTPMLGSHGHAAWPKEVIQSGTEPELKVRGGSFTVSCVQ